MSRKRPYNITTSTWNAFLTNPIEIPMNQRQYDWGKKELKLSQKFFNKRNLEIFNSLKKIIYYFKKNNIVFWLDLGALLAVCRNQDLAETSDVDILVNYYDLSKLEKVCKILSSKNKKYIFQKKFIYQSKLINKKKIKQLTYNVLLLVFIAIRLSLKNFKHYFLISYKIIPSIISFNNIIHHFTTFSMSKI